MAAGRNGGANITNKPRKPVVVRRLQESPRTNGPGAGEDDDDDDNEATSRRRDDDDEDDDYRPSRPPMRGRGRKASTSPARGRGSGQGSARKQRAVSPTGSVRSAHSVQTDPAVPSRLRQEFKLTASPSKKPKTKRKQLFVTDKKDDVVGESLAAEVR